MYKKGQGLGIVGLIVIVIVAYLILNNVEITYKTFHPTYSDIYCSNGVPVVDDFMGIGSGLANYEAGAGCYNFRTSRHEFVCEADKVVIECKATIWNVYVSKAPPAAIIYG